MAYPKKERMDYRISPTYMSFMEYGGVKLNLINLIVTWTKYTVLNLIKKNGTVLRLQHQYYEAHSIFYLEKIKRMAHVAS